ncbi:MAG: hypothetical protein J1F14_01945 [Treponema sp.]|nr:hypothetical protein [Treponema sp.]
MTKSDRLVRIIGMVVVSLFALSLGGALLRFLSCFRAARTAGEFPAGDYMRVYIYGRGDSTVSARLSMYDTNSQEVCLVERSWASRNIVIDFVSAKFSSVCYTFPLEVRGRDSSFMRGTSLSRYVNSSRGCALAGASLELKERDAWHTLSSFALSPMARLFEGRHISYSTLDLSPCETGKEYAVRIDWAGNVFLMEI